jgi:hypothetical protein
VPGFCDKHATFLPHDATSLSKCKFDDTRVKVMASRPAAGTGRWPDGREVHELPFGLGYDLVFDDENIALAQALVLLLQG